MSKISRKKGSGESDKDDLSGGKRIAQLLEEIIRESLNPDCNLIVLEGKIRELEESGKNCVPLMMKRIRQGNGREQKVVFDLFLREKDKRHVTDLEKIVHEDSISIKIRRQALMELKKWEETVDDDLLKLLDEGEEIIFAIEKYARLGGLLDKEIDPSIVLRFAHLPGNLKVSIIKQALDEYPESFSLVLKLIQDEACLDEKIIDILAAKGTLEVGNLFSKILVKTRDKNLRRLLKKHLFQMKNRGVEVIIPTTEDVEPPKFLKIESPQVKAYTTGIDYLGERLVFLSKSVLGWGVVFFQITLSDLEGIKNFSAFELNRKEIKNFIQKFSEEGVITLIDISPDYVYYMIEEAYQINLNKGISLPRQFSQWKAELNELKGDVAAPIIHTCNLMESFQEENLRVRREKYATLNDLDTFKNWFLEPRLVWEHIKKYKEVETSPLILSPYQKEERMDSVVAEAARKIFNDTYRRIYKRRLEEMAYILLRTHKEKSAKLALCAAHDLRPEGLSSERHGFLINLIQRSIHLYGESEKEDRKDSLIISPK